MIYSHWSNQRRNVWSRKVFICCKYCSYLPGALSDTVSHTKFSACVFWTNIWFGTKWQNDKRLQPTNFCQRGSISSSERSTRRVVIIKFTSKSLRVLRSVWTVWLQTLKYFISGMCSLYFSLWINLVFLRGQSLRPNQIIVKLTFTPNQAGSFNYWQWEGRQGPNPSWLDVRRAKSCLFCGLMLTRRRGQIMMW